MKEIKTIVDREPLGTDYIESKQDFGHVLNQVKKLKPPIWKTAWFYGPVGLGVVAIAISIFSFNPKERVMEDKHVEAEIVKEHYEPPVEPLNTSMQLALVSEETSNTLPEREEKKVEAEPAVSEVNEEIPVEKDEVLPVIVEQEVVEEVVPEKVERNLVSDKNVLPHIEGVFTGEIPFTTLCHENGIRVNSRLQVVEFNIHFETGHGTETVRVLGNTIPHKVSEKIFLYNLNHMVFITDVKGVTNDGKRVALPSMNFIPYK